VGLAGIEPATSALSGRSEDSLSVPMRAGTCRFRWSPDSSGVQRGTCWEPVRRAQTQLLGWSWDGERILAERSIEICAARRRVSGHPNRWCGGYGRFAQQVRPVQAHRGQSIRPRDLRVELLSSPPEELELDVVRVAERDHGVLCVRRLLDA
jgi:hypothetical protein